MCDTYQLINKTYKSLKNEKYASKFHFTYIPQVQQEECVWLQPKSVALQKNKDVITMKYTRDVLINTTTHKNDQE